MTAAYPQADHMEGPGGGSHDNDIMVFETSSCATSSASGAAQTDGFHLLVQVAPLFQQAAG